MKTMIENELVYKDFVIENHKTIWKKYFLIKVYENNYLELFHKHDDVPSCFPIVNGDKPRRMDSVTLGTDILKDRDLNLILLFDYYLLLFAVDYK